MLYDPPIASKKKRRVRYVFQSAGHIGGVIFTILGGANGCCIIEKKECAPYKPFWSETGCVLVVFTQRQ